MTNQPTKYHKKPVVIEARQLTGSTADVHAIYQWVESNTLGSFEPMAVIEGRLPYPASGVSIDPRNGRLIISTLQGLHWANLGDWIIRGVHGEFYPCKPDIFAATYEPAETAPARREAPDVADLRHLAENATPGPWFWWGNTDNHNVALCGRQPGLGVCEVISTLSVERSTTGREADQIRSELSEYTNLTLSGIEDAVEEWATDEYGQPRTDQRLSVTDENHIRRTVEELAVYAVARAQGLPDDTPRDHERVYRADMCDIRATNARFIAAASPEVVLGLLDRLAHMREARDNARAEVERLTGQIEAAKRIGLGTHLGLPWADVLNDVLRALGVTRAGGAS